MRCRAQVGSISRSPESQFQSTTICHGRRALLRFLADLSLARLGAHVEALVWAFGGLKRHVRTSIPKLQANGSHKKEASFARETHKDGHLPVTIRSRRAPRPKGGQRRNIRGKLFHLKTQSLGDGELLVMQSSQVRNSTSGLTASCIVVDCPSRPRLLS